MCHDGAPAAADNVYVAPADWGSVVVDGSYLEFENFSIEYTSGTGLKVNPVATGTVLRRVKGLAAQFWLEGINTLAEDVDISHVITQSPPGPECAYDVNPDFGVGECFNAYGNSRGLILGREGSNRVYNQICRRCLVTRSWNLARVDGPNTIEESVFWGAPNHGLEASGSGVTIRDSMVFRSQDSLYLGSNPVADLIVERNTFQNGVYVTTSDHGDGGTAFGAPWSFRFNLLRTLIVDRWAYVARRADCNIYMGDGDLFRIITTNGIPGVDYTSIASQEPYSRILPDSGLIESQFDSMTGAAGRVLPATPEVCGQPAGAAIVQAPQVDGTLPLPLPLFPADNWWNLDISGAPLDAGSASFISFIGTTRRPHPDWGGSAGDTGNPNATYGIPFVVVPGTQPLMPVTFGYADESDAGAPGQPPGYPLPEQAKTQAGWIEGGNPGNVAPDGDRHMLIVDRDNRLLYELYQAHWNVGLSRWEAGSGAVFPLTSNLRRPDTWTSADAAGLAVLPGLVRYDEAFGADPIRHAFRVTVRSTNGYVFPASHRAGSQAGALPLGARLRLKASVNISSYPAYIQRILQAMKTYGLIVADNGSDMYITGTSDPRWEPYMAQLNSAFNQLNASMFDVVRRGWNPPPDDLDDDGLPNAWETKFGLDPSSGADVNGASGDPDGDGLTNAQELAGGTHPRGFYKRLFAEGVSNTFFRTRFAALNSGASAAHVLFRFLRTSGGPVSHVLTMSGQSRVTLDPASVAGMTDEPYSTIVESDQEVVVDRTMSWDASGYGSHAETGLASASTTWFLAEGATHGFFDLFYLIQNPGTTDAQVTVRYLRPAPLPPLDKTYTVGANRRLTIWVDNEVFNNQPLLAATDVSAAITSSVPIVVERAMYMTTGGQAFGAGHESAAVTAPSTNWFLAEGATGDFFDMYILIANPDPSMAATVRATYMLPGGTTLTKDYTIAPASRYTLSVDNETFDGQALLANVTVSTVLQSTNGVPIVVERSMWWPGGAAGPWYEAHNSPGATSTGTIWGLADGEVGGPSSAATYILVANTSPATASVRVTVYVEGGGTAVRTFSVPGNSRFSVDVAGAFGATVVDHRFGALVESVGTAPAQLVVERAMYTNAGGRFWAAGTNALGTKLR